MFILLPIAPIIYPIITRYLLIHLPSFLLTEDLFQKQLLTIAKRRELLKNHILKNFNDRVENYSKHFENQNNTLEYKYYLGIWDLMVVFLTV